MKRVLFLSLFFICIFNSTIIGNSHELDNTGKGNTSDCEADKDWIKIEAINIGDDITIRILSSEALLINRDDIARIYTKSYVSQLLPTNTFSSRKDVNNYVIEPTYSGNLDFIKGEKITGINLTINHKNYDFLLLPNTIYSKNKIETFDEMIEQIIEDSKQAVTGKERKLPTSIEFSIRNYNNSKIKYKTIRHLNITKSEKEFIIHKWANKNGGSDIYEAQVKY